MKAAPARLAVLLGASVAGVPSHAALWTWESNLQMRAEVNDNIALVADPAGTAHRLLLQPALTATRQTENTVTRVDGGLDLVVESTTESRRNVDGRLLLNHAVTDVRNNYSAGLSFAQSDTYNDGLTANDVLVGRTRRSTYGATTSWSHSFTERLSSQAQLALSDTGYSSTSSAAEDYRDRTVSGSLNYRWDELLTLGLTLSHADYAAKSGLSGTLSDSLRLTSSRALNERSSTSFSIGGYSTRSNTSVFSLVCPLEPRLCDAGVVNPIAVRSDRVVSGQGWLFDLSYNASLNETTTLGLSAGRELAPSGIGVVQSARFNASLSHAFSPTLRGTATAAQSSSSQPGPVDRLRPRLRSADLALNWSLAEDLSLAAGATARQFSEPRAGTRATSNAFYVSLQYQGPKRFATR